MFKIVTFSTLTLQKRFVTLHSSEIDKLALPNSATILKTNCLLTKSTTHYNKQTSPYLDQTDDYLV